MTHDFMVHKEEDALNVKVDYISAFPSLKLNGIHMLLLKIDVFFFHALVYCSKNYLHAAELQEIY